MVNICTISHLKLKYLLFILCEDGMWAERRSSATPPLKLPHPTSPGPQNSSKENLKCRGFSLVNFADFFFSWDWFSFTSSFEEYRESSQLSQNNIPFYQGFALHFTCLNKIHVIFTYSHHKSFFLGKCGLENIAFALHILYSPNLPKFCSGEKDKFQLAKE